jgi:hypothetical protein
MRRHFRKQAILEKLLENSIKKTRSVVVVDDLRRGAQLSL